MSISRSVAEILSEHVTLELECIDRIYLNVFVPRLQREVGVAGFFRFHRGHRFASSVLMDPISQAFVDAMGRFAQKKKRDVVSSRKGGRKDDVMNDDARALRPGLAQATDPATADKSPLRNVFYRLQSLIGQRCDEL
jgi:hypothetical protein